MVSGSTDMENCQVAKEEQKQFETRTQWLYQDCLIWDNENHPYPRAAEGASPERPPAAFPFTKDNKPWALLVLGSRFQSPQSIFVLSSHHLDIFVPAAHKKGRSSQSDPDVNKDNKILRPPSFTFQYYPSSSKYNLTVVTA